MNQRLHKSKKYNHEEGRNKFHPLLPWRNPSPQKGRKVKATISDLHKFLVVVGEGLVPKIFSKMMTLRLFRRKSLKTILHHLQTFLPKD